MKIDRIEAIPCSFPIPPQTRVRLGMGTAVKRDAVIVKVTTDDGLVGWGESHHGRSPGTVAKLVETTISDAAIGWEATDVVGLWNRVYKLQLGSHGLGAAAAIAMSGLDMALWDIRGKAVGWPLYKLLGGAPKEIAAYAGGISLGHSPVAELVEEVGGFVRAGYGAVKLRLGDNPADDIARVEAVRSAHPGLTILVDANTAYSVEDARMVIPALDANGVGWLEEPFPPHDYRSYSAAAAFGTVPFAAGENHYTRFEFNRLVSDGVVRIFQPDLSKSGGVTEVMRIAALASTWKIPINTHTSTSGVSMAATVHLLTAIENSGYYESEASVGNVFRDELVSSGSYTVSKSGTVKATDAPGLGIELDEELLRAHPVIEGAGYV
jgi:L-alanine-DL-glutamate epimerase-like enolase superfamily enzyme